MKKDRMTPRTPTLEPVRPALLWVSLAHLLLAVVLTWMTWHATGVSEMRLPSSQAPAASAPAEELWFDPSRFDPLIKTAASPLPPAAAAPALAPMAEPASSDPAAVNARYITLSRLHATMPGGTSAPPSAALSARELNELDRLDEALYEAFMRAWLPPDARQLPRDRRSVRLDVTLNPDVTIAHSELAAPSGSSELDLSVLAAAAEVAAQLRERASTGARSKFPAMLPGPLANSRYDCRIQFHVE